VIVLSRRDHRVRLPIVVEPPTRTLKDDFAASLAAKILARPSNRLSARV
jgi:hypothetical protein